MKICLMASGFPPVPPLGTGAVEYDVFGLAVALADLGNDVYVVDTGDNYRRNQIVASSQIRLYKVRHPHFFSNLIYRSVPVGIREFLRHCTQLFFSIFSVSTFTKFILRNEIDLLNPHARYSGFFAHLTRKLLSSKIPLVFSSHTSLWMKEHLSTNMKLFLLPESVCLKASTRATTVSRALKHYIIKHLQMDSTKIIPIYNGVDTTVFRPNPNPIANPFPVILYVSSIRKIKNQVNAVKTMPEIIKTFPQAKLVFIGRIYDPSYYEHLMSVSRKLGVEKNVVYLGEQNMFDLPVHFKRADVVLYPNTLESSFPRVLMEALSCGKASVVSNVPPIQEALPEDAAVMVDPMDPKAMALSVISVLEDKHLMRTLETKAREFAVERFSWVSIAKAYEKVFAESIECS